MRWKLWGILILIGGFAALETGMANNNDHHRMIRETSVFFILDQLEGKKNWSVKTIEAIVGTSLGSETDSENTFFAVYQSSAGLPSSICSVEVRLSRKGSPRKGLIILKLAPNLLTLKDVQERYGASNPSLATTDVHNQSVFYEYKRSFGWVRFGAIDASSLWITAVVLDRFEAAGSVDEYI
jgi:hypothetical protein